MHSSDAEQSSAGRSLGLVEALASISAGGSGLQSLERLVASACELASASQGALVVLDREGGAGRVLTCRVDPDSLRALSRTPLGRGLLGEVAGSAEAVVYEGLTLGDGAPADFSPSTLLGVPVRSGGTPLAVLLLADPTAGLGHELSTQLEALGGVAAYLVEILVAHDLAERRRVWLEAGSQFAADLQPPVIVDDALTLIAATALDASECDTVLIVTVPNGGSPYPSATVGVRPDLGSVGTDHLDAAVRAVAESQNVGEVSLGSGHRAVLAPLGEHLSTPSILVLLYLDHRVPDSNETELLGAFAEQAGLSLDRVRALHDRAAMAVVSDRDRIARELHDVVIQRLFATGLHLQKSRSMVSDPDLRERLDLTAHDLDHTIRDIRTTIFDLREQPRQSLRTTLRDLVAGHAPDLGFLPTVHTVGAVDEPLSTTATERLGEVLSQALSNVARHAEASSAQVDVQLTDAAVRVRVSDDGCGVSPGAPELGLASLRRRLVLEGGSLDVWENDPCGTTLVASIPRA